MLNLTTKVYVKVCKVLALFLNINLNIVNIGEMNYNCNNKLDSLHSKINNFHNN